MTPQSELEIKGNFLTHPFAELLTEIARAHLNGSLRVSDREKKCIFYFKSGSLVFAVSNARQSRLFDVLLRRNKLTKEELAKVPNFGNDLELSAYLQEKQLLTGAECDRLFSEQIEGIVVEVLSWPSADWTFSPLARVREGLAFPIDTRSLLIEYGRCLPVDRMLGRFRSLDESFVRSGVPETEYGLRPEEAFVLSRADDGLLTAKRLVSVSAMSESAALQSIYTLWLGGLLDRHEWQPAFSDEMIVAMRTAKLELKKEARLTTPTEKPGEVSETPEVPEQADKQPEPSITVEEYLERVESAETYYDVLGVDAKADTDELKRSYFALARMFHPDRFHAEGGAIFQRVQKAFTELAQAHETLKNIETREVYDYRMRKELAEREKRRSGDEGLASLQQEKAAENFDSGFDLLMDDDPEAAVPYLARAVHFAPQNARYHAYYGKALSIDSTQRFKAEAELQAAVKLDPNNPTFRIFLAEFFIQFNLLKRAEGELNRLLSVFPGNKEALDLLNTLQR